jgi:DDE superfamily endonuclease
VVYSYAIIIEAALTVQRDFDWDAGVKDLTFSSHWVRCLLNRANMRRRKITTDDKKIPIQSEIVRIMGIGQNLIKEKGLFPHQILNMDETGHTYAVGPDKMYIPPDQSRAQNIGVANDKLRITAVVAVFGTGEFAPLFLIIKHSVSSQEKPDQSRMKVIQDLHKKDNGFGVKDGWDLILWEKKINISGIEETHKCYYIINTRTGAVITSQFKAWNDTVRMIMWLELVVKPLKEKLNDLLIWFDNCGCHKTAVVDEVIHNLNVYVACLPPNMTGVLQVLDLVVNGPLKAHCRKLRGSRIVSYFQEYAELYAIESQKNLEDREVLKFIAPKPSMLQGINDLFDLFANGFQETKFREGVNRSFISTGCLPIYNTDPTVYNFVPYTQQKTCGTMKIIPTGTRNHSDTDLHSNTNSNTVAASADENADILYAIDSYLDYDSDDENAMNALLNL